MRTIIVNIKANKPTFGANVTKGFDINQDLIFKFYVNPFSNQLIRMINNPIFKEAIIVVNPYNIQSYSLFSFFVLMSPTVQTSKIFVFIDKIRYLFSEMLF